MYNKYAIDAERKRISSKSRSHDSGHFSHDKAKGRKLKEQASVGLNLPNIEKDSKKVFMNFYN